MTRSPLLVLAGLAFASLCAPSRAEPEATPAAPTTAAKAPLEPKEPIEPNVKYTVIDDDTAHIEEMRVRGSTQRIVVTPKVGPKVPYEIITGDGSRDLGEGVNTSRGAAGKRVWNVLNF